MANLMGNDFESLIIDFNKVADLSGLKLAPNELTIEILQAPHESPKALPANSMAIYIFMYGGKCLKVGKVGNRSHARYTSQHYNPKSSNSNLAKSILNDDDSPFAKDLDEFGVGTWIRNNTTRINLILKTRAGIAALNLLEAFIQCRLKPKYEGFKNQN